MLALPQATFFLLLEVAVGGTIALFWVHLRGEVPRGFFRFTGACLLVCGALAIWLRSSFPPGDLVAPATMWFQAERLLSLLFVAVFAVYLVVPKVRVVGPLVPLLALACLWAAALVVTSPQLRLPRIAGIRVSDREAVIPRAARRHSRRSGQADHRRHVGGALHAVHRPRVGGRQAVRVRGHGDDLVGPKAERKRKREWPS